MNNTIYLVLLNWSTDDSDGIETFLYDDWDPAYKKYCDLIADTKDPGVSPLRQVFDEDGETRDGYELDSNNCERNQTELYWHLVEKSNYNRHYFLDLKRTGLQ